MTTEAITTIAALLSGSLGWLAFAKEYRAHRETKWVADCLDESREIKTAQLRLLTDRDERGRFVNREGV